MSLKPEGINAVPEETACIAHAAYPKGNVSMRMRDELGTIYQDESFAHLFSHTGQPAEARLSLSMSDHHAVCVISLSDRQAADAVRGRIAWKYALGLELTDPGFDASVLSEFRKRLVEGHAEEQLLTAMLTLFKERGWRHPPAANSGRIRPMCWQRFAPSTAWSVWEKRCAMR